MIDASHANSRKNPARQMDVISDIATQVARGSRSIFGVMIESNIVAGRQEVIDTQALTYGQSITDACIGWEDTECALELLADAVKRSGRV
jgi:3-deoxy-7-phosphoheptulonate synthase